ncbi:MAG: hypothetical protein Q9174_004334, partial [Haloplaca sp. 1 TL-2023]
MRSSSSARKPLQTSSQDSQNYGFREDFSRTTPKKRKHPPDPDSSKCQIFKKPRLIRDSVKRSSHPDAAGPALRVLTPSHQETSFDITASALQDMLGTGSSLHVGLKIPMDSATSRRPSYRYDAAEKAFKIFAHGVVFTMSAADSPPVLSNSATSSYLGGNTQKTDTNVRKNIPDYLAAVISSNQKQSPDDPSDIGPTFKPLANHPRENIVARLKRASGVESTHISSSNVDCEGICAANKNGPNAAIAALSAKKVPNKDVTGIMQIEKAPFVTRPRLSKPQSKHTVTGQSLAAQRLHKEVSRRNTTGICETPLEPHNAATRAYTGGSSMDSRRSHPRKKHIS